MSKKMLKRSLALGALMAFVITGQAWAADNVLNGLAYTSDGRVNWDGSAIVNTQLGGNDLGEMDSYDGVSNRSYGLAVTTGSPLIDKNVDITNSVSGTNRNYGIVIESGSSLTISGITDVVVSGTGKQQLRGIRNNGGTLTVDGDTVVNVNLTSGVGGNIDLGDAYVTGMDTWNGKTVFNGNVQINASAAYSTKYDWVNAVQVGTNGVIEFNGDETTLTASNTGYTAVAVNFGKAGGKVSFNSNTTVINANSDKGVNGLGFNDDDHIAIFTGENVTINSTITDGVADTNAIGIFANVSATNTVENFTVNVTGSGLDNGTYGYANGTAGIYASGLDVDIAAQNLNVTVNGNDSGFANRSDTHGIFADKGGTVQVTSKNINVTVTDSVGEGYGVLAGWNEGDTAHAKGGNGSITLGGDDSVVTVNVTANDATGIMARGQNGSSTEGSTLTVNGKLLDIDVKGNASYGVYVGNGTYGSQTGKTSLAINSETTDILATGTESYGIMNVSDGKLNINSNVKVEADTVLNTRGSAQTYINTNEDGTAITGKTTVLKGDIAFDYATNSGTPVDATVKISLDGEGSSWTGDTKMTDASDNVLVDLQLDNNGVKSSSDATNFTVSNFTLNVSNGAKWTTDSNSFVNKLTVGGSDASLNLVGDNAHTVLIGDATFKDGSKLYIKNGDNYLASTLNYALEVGNLTVENGAKIEIGGITEDVTYNIAKGVNATKEVGEKWTIDNNLLTGTWTDTEGLQVTTKAKDAGQIAEDMGVDSGTASALGSIIEAANSDNVPDAEAAKNVVEFVEKIADAPSEVAAAAAEAVIKMAEAGGNSATAASIVKNVTGVTNDRLSFNCGHSAPHKGGHGVGLFEEGSGADIWAEYVHGKDKVEDMKSTAGATSYEGQYNGFVLGVDFKKVNKFQSGIAFNYGEGDTNTVGSAIRTRSDYDFWGVGYYGNIHNDDSNVIFDINYAQTDSDVTQKNLTGDIEASPETTTWSAGVKLEKLYQNENVQIVPYTGLRYMSIDPDDYATKCGTYKYSMDRQDIWLLPVGVSIRQEIANDNGWTVSPRVDLSYIWAFGDTDSNMEFATALNTKTNIGYDVMDDGSFLGLVGIEAHKGQWGYGVAYSYQKGDHSESKKWYVDVNYSF